MRGIDAWLNSALMFSLVLGACTTTRRATQLVVDHHLGMARGAMDILSGEAEAREQRVTKLSEELEASRQAIAEEQDQERLVNLLRQHMTLQDALLAELLPGQHHHQHRHKQSQEQQERTGNE
jgi:hypothetical protein